MPMDSDLQVSLNPVDPGLSQTYPMLTGEICNRSTGWTATTGWTANITVNFAFYAPESMLPTGDRGSLSAPDLAPQQCELFVTTLSTTRPWQTIGVDSATSTWRR
jgi:hypothetical protein